MEIKGLFNGSFEVIEKAMDLRSTKHNIIVSNISNADTPNYKAFDMIVEEEMAKKMNSKGHVKLKTSDPKHISRSGKCCETSLSNIYENTIKTIKGDNNTVELDKEMGKLMENNLLYNTLANVISKKFYRLKSVIQSSRG